MNSIPSYSYFQLKGILGISVKSISLSKSHYLQSFVEGTRKQNCLLLRVAIDNSDDKVFLIDSGKITTDNDDNTTVNINIGKQLEFKTTISNLPILNSYEEKEILMHLKKLRNDETAPLSPSLLHDEEKWEIIGSCSYTLTNNMIGMLMCKEKKTFVMNKVEVDLLLPTATEDIFCTIGIGLKILDTIRIGVDGIHCNGDNHMIGADSLSLSFEEAEDEERSEDEPDELQQEEETIKPVSTPMKRKSKHLKRSSSSSSSCHSSPFRHITEHAHSFQQSPEEILLLEIDTLQGHVAKLENDIETERSARQLLLEMMMKTDTELAKRLTDAREELDSFKILYDASEKRRGQLESMREHYERQIGKLGNEILQQRRTVEDIGGLLKREYAKRAVIEEERDAVLAELIEVKTKYAQLQTDSNYKLSKVVDVLRANSSSSSSGNHDDA